jgi:hypothetical protein
MKHIALCCLIMLVSAPLFAYDWQSKQITREASSDKEDKTIALKDSAGNMFYVENGEDITEEEVTSILSIKDSIFGWQSIKIKEARFVSEGGVISVLITPESVTWNSVDITPNLTAGMLFSFENQTLSYNFRIKKDNYFLRITGAYISEKVLCDKMLEAVQTPQTFVQRRDPDYLLSHIDKIDAEMNLIRKIAIALNNKGLFSSDGPVDDAVIDKVVKMKRENSKATKKEIKENLSKENIKITDRALELIFNVYFYEFEK